MSSTSTSGAPAWASAVSDLARRVMGRDAAGHLSLRHLPDSMLAEGGVADAPRNATFEARRGQLTIQARDGVAACVALHHYLRTAVGQAVHWDTVLPLVIGGLPGGALPGGGLPDAELTTLTARVEEQYMMNYCTFGYTMPYWGWAEWEREIDWMALHGITMPLAITGFEATLHAVYTELGVPRERVLEFLGSPSYVAWAYMGCLESVLPAMDLSWLERQEKLGRAIVERQRSLGMTPVLPAFTGQVPQEVAPESVTSRLWQGYETWVLDPAHPLFSRIGEAVVRTQTELFGTDHLYASDPFIEMVPVDSDPDYPGRVAQAILAGLTGADPQARWLLQAWAFSDKPDYWTPDQVRTFLGAIEVDRLIVLDLWAEQEPQWSRFDSFSGMSWHWCGLLNFGGRTDPMANLAGAVDGSRDAMAAEHPPVGIGMSMEATRNNHVFFDVLADLAWNDVPALADWIDRFGAERYGTDVAAATPRLRQAWSLLAETIYSPNALSLHPEEYRGLLTRRPSTTLHEERGELESAMRSLVWYEPARLLDAWEILTTAVEGDDRLGAGPVGRDLVDTAVAVLCRVADILLLRVIDTGEHNAEASSDLLELFGLLDDLLACRLDYRMSAWEASATSATDSEAQREQFLTASRQILTTWSAEPATFLDDYAARVWHGLVGDYYRPRWATWLEFAAAGFPDDAVDGVNETLDSLSARVVRSGVHEHARPSTELGARSRAALDRFAPIFLDGFPR